MKAEILDFIASYLEKDGVAASRLKEYMQRIKHIKDPTETAELNRFEQMVALFEKYGKKYNFDPLMLTAQGYQESQLNQKARSQGGAIGVMQVMPAIGKEMKVGDIRIIEPNIQAGTKYMDRSCRNSYPTATSTRTTAPSLPRELQCRSRKHLEDAQGSRQTRS